MHRLLSLLLVAACGAAAHPAPPRDLVEASHVEHLGSIARETAIVEHPSGRLFVAGYGLAPHPQLWQSDDHGATWSSVALGGGAVGDSDVDLAVAPDGTIYFASLVYDRAKLEGRSIAIGVSRDTGTTWTWTTLSTQPFDDRPWVAVASDGSAHVIWSSETGVHHAVSRDRGATWQDAGLLAGHGGSSHLVAGPHGLLAARIIPVWGGGMKLTPGADRIVLSTDSGATWENVAAPGQREWMTLVDAQDGDTPHWVEPLAFDPGGDLYSMWADKVGVHLARSHDRGATWAMSLLATGNAFFPYMIATEPNVIVATWFTASAPALADLRWHLARFDGTRIAEIPPQRLECFGKDARGAEVQDTCGEYLMPAALDGDRIGVAATIQHAPRDGFTFWTFETR